MATLFLAEILLASVAAGAEIGPAIETAGRFARWTHFTIADPLPGSSWGTSGPVLGEFDGDGRPDRLPMKTPGLKPRGVIWANSGEPNSPFVPIVIHVGNPGWHAVSVGDVNGDGAPDLVSKIWNKDGPTYHADFWRNDNPSRKRAPSSPRGTQP